MTATYATHAEPRVARGLVGELFRREPLFAGTALCLLVLALPTLVAFGLDPRTYHDVSVWSKPLKFEASLVLYAGTLAWFAGWLSAGTTGRRWYRVFTAVVVFCIAAEMAWLIGAAANGVASHFNETTPLMAWLYRLMGLFAVVLTSATLVYSLRIHRGRGSALDPAMRSVVVTGLVLTFILTVAVAGFMAQYGAHFVGGNLSDAEAMPLMGWARDGGDLRVAHFFATHAMQAIPLFGLAASRLLAPAPALASVRGFSLLYVGLVAYAFVEALQGRPFLPFLG
jgi:hypothetical protein